MVNPIISPPGGGPPPPPGGFVGAQQRAQQYTMYTPRGVSPSQSESWLRRRMENIENHPQARLPGFARRYLFNVDTHPRIPVTNRHRELAEIEEALQKESHVRRGEMVLERRRRLAEQWRQQHSGGGSAAQQVAAAAQPEEDFEDVFETVNKYFRDLPDEDDVPATQSSGRPPPPPPPPRGRNRSRSERRRFPEKPDSEWVPTEQMFPDKEDTSWDPRREPKNAPSRASYLKPPDLSGIDSHNIETPPRSRASSRRRDRRSIDDNNVDTPAGSRASSQASAARGRQAARAVLEAGKPTFDYGPAAAAVTPARRSGKLSSFKAYDPDAPAVRPMRPGRAPSSGPALPARMYR